MTDSKNEKSAPYNYNDDNEYIPKYINKLSAPNATTQMKLRSSVVKIAPAKEPEYIPDLTDKYAIAEEIVNLAVTGKAEALVTDRINKVIALVNTEALPSTPSVAR